MYLCACVCVLLFSIHLCRVHFLCPCQVLFDCLICRWAAVSAAKWEIAAKNIVAYFSVAHWKWCAINTRAKPAMSTATTPLLAMKTSTKIKKFLCLFASLFGQWRGRNGEIGMWEGGMACKLQLAVCRCRCCCCYCYYVCCCCCFCWTNRSLQILIFMQQRKSCSARRGAAATACGRARNLCSFLFFRSFFWEIKEHKLLLSGQMNVCSGWGRKGKFFKAANDVKIFHYYTYIQFQSIKASAVKANFTLSVK